MKRKLVSILCIIALCFTTMVPSFAAEVNNNVSTTAENGININPLYADTITEEDLASVKKGTVTGIKLSNRTVGSAAVDYDGYESSIDNIAADVRAAMVERESYIEVMCHVNTDYFDFTALTNEIFEKAIIHTGNPKEGDYLKWVWSVWSSGAQYYYIGNDYYITLYFDISYYTTAKQEAVVDSYIANLKNGWNMNGLSDAEKVEVMYDYICDNIVYDYDNLDDVNYKLKYTAYAALINKKAVCQGYALLLYRLCLEYGIDARFISGDGGGPHGWNIIKLGNYYYFADSTWDAVRYEYGYFLKGSNEFLLDHTLDTEFKTAEFKRAYPISATDYSSSGAVDLDTPVVSLSTIASSGKPKATWNAVPNATKYEVWRKAGSAGLYVKHYITTATSVTDTATTPGTVYYYIVRAIHDNGSETYYSDFSVSRYITCDLARPAAELTNVKSSGKPLLTWNAVDGADKYEVWRKVGSTGTYVKYYTTTATSMTNNMTNPGKIYYYKVKAICSENSAGNSAFSLETYRACDLAQPVTTLTTIASSGKPKLTWDAVEGASKYEVWRKVGSSGTYVKYYTTTATSMTNTKTTPGTLYYYKVRAICSSNSGGNSAFSTEKYIACDLAQPVTSLTTVASSGKPILFWTAVEGASKYEVWRKVGSSGSYIKYYTTTGTSMTNTMTTPGVVYYYKVKAICSKNSGGNSAFSSEKYATCKCASPELTVTLNEAGKPRLTWAKVAGATKYEIWRKTGSSGTYQKFYSTTGTAFVNSSAVKGTTYYYKIKAICGRNSNGNSLYSAEVEKKSQ